MKTLTREAIKDVYTFFERSVKVDLSIFSMPHKTDMKSVADIFQRTSHIPLGIFCNGDLIGYALIRLFFPKKGSYAIFVAQDWQGKGIGTAALEKELALIRNLGFTPFSAVCKKNIKSLRMLDKLGIEFIDDIGDYFEVKDRKKTDI
ncbi:MAG: GNAT family N-acetyltransferase [Candidatus Omnitrophota bacterium]